MLVASKLNEAMHYHRGKIKLLHNIAICRNEGTDIDINSKLPEIL